jgi:hypothetical protein
MIGRLVSTSLAGSATHGAGGMLDTLALGVQAPAQVSTCGRSYRVDRNTGR